MRRACTGLFGAALLCATPAFAQAPQSEADQAAGRRLQELLRAHGSDVYGCWDLAQQAAPSTTGGEVLMRLVVAPGGAVERAEVLKDGVGSRRLGDCLVSAMRAWKAPDLAASDSQQYVFPLVFKADSSTAASKPAGKGTAAASGSGKPASAPGKALRYIVPLSQGKPGPLGTGRVEARVLVAESTVGPTQASLTILSLHPLARLALHQHPGSLELLYVLKGLGRLRDATGQMTEAHEGDVIVAPAGITHNIEAAPFSLLQMVQIFAPAGPEHAYLDPRDRSGTVPMLKGAGRKNLTSPDGAPATVVEAAKVTSYPIANGKGEAALLLDQLPIGAASLQRFEASAGAEVPAHSHERSDELLYIVSGRAEMIIDGKTTPVGPGDAVHIPMGTPHQVKVIERLVAVQCYAPGGPEQRFKPRPAQ
jgi:quercetin dioxygenase-like cupin family protein